MRQNSDEVWRGKIWGSSEAYVVGSSEGAVGQCPGIAEVGDLEFRQIKFSTKVE